MEKLKGTMIIPVIGYILGLIIPPIGLLYGAILFLYKKDIPLYRRHGRIIVYFSIIVFIIRFIIIRFILHH